ncbi:hypothetical protein CPB84DRAFT_1748544 [Gymnopilus junonius]|uniref:Uncharacterized protein n=1 Tax=Gymnopilus junonius TaxID=109634 RepID=A0A9P5TKP3_GYMJU|nr:hypothetical protein CPB84DRAFT_1748544 [Gymnopilus junonius]
MTFKGGHYQIRWVPRAIKVPFIGGVYATGDIINAPVLTEALGPSATGEQTWNVQPVEGKPNIYTIAYPGFSAPPGVNLGVGPVLPGWGLRNHRSGHTDPVVLSVHIAEWEITAVDSEHGVYQISEPAELVGAIQAVTEEHDRLCVKSYPVIRDMPALPRWQFVPASN